MPLTQEQIAAGYTEDNKDGRIYNRPIVDRYTAPSAPVEDPNMANFANWLKTNLTPAPSTAPVVTPPTTGRTYKGRDGKIYNSSTGKEDITATWERYFSPEAIAREKKAIEAQNASLRQGVIDSINVQYGGKIKKTEQLGQEDLARQRSMNLRSGVIDSPIGDTEIGKTKKATAEEIALIENEKTQAIQNALFKMDELATKKLEAATNARRQAGQDELAYRQSLLEADKEIKAGIKESLASIGKAGISIEQFKLDPAYKQAKDSGLSDLEILSAINENSPQPTNLTTKIVGDRVITSYFDPITKKTVVTSDPLGFTPNDPDNQQIVQAGGNIFMYDKNSKKLTTLFEGPEDGGKDLTGTDLKIAYDDAAGQTVSYLEEQGLFKTSEYLTPAKYRELKNAWIKNGMPSADFDLRFMSYIDPTKATTYPVDKGVSNKFGSTPTFNITTGE